MHPLKIIAAAGGLLCLFCLCLLCAACGQSKQNSETTTDSAQTTATTTATTAATTAAATAPAASGGTQFESTDAVKIMESYANSVLGLDEKETYKFLVNNNPRTIEDETYFEIIASIKQENADGTSEFLHKGTFFVRTDGKRVLRQDDETLVDITNQKKK